MSRYMDDFVCMFDYFRHLTLESAFVSQLMFWAHGFEKTSFLHSCRWSLVVIQLEQLKKQQNWCLNTHSVSESRCGEHYQHNACNKAVAVCNFISKTLWPIMERILENYVQRIV